MLDIVNAKRVLPSSSLVLTFTSPVARSSRSTAVWFFYMATVTGVVFQELSDAASTLARVSKTFTHPSQP